MREHDVTALTAAELEAARRELAASLALAPRSACRSRPAWPPSTPNSPGGQPPGPAYPAPRALNPRAVGARVEEDAPAPRVPGRLDGFLTVRYVLPQSMRQAARPGQNHHISCVAGHGEIPDGLRDPCESWEP